MAGISTGGTEGEQRNVTVHRVTRLVMGGLRQRPGLSAVLNQAGNLLTLLEGCASFQSEGEHTPYESQAHK